MDLGPHAAYILGAYGFTALVIGALVAHAILDRRAQERALARLQEEPQRQDLRGQDLRGRR
ncbi:heme exporter protein CcmD [Methylobacterium nonmethylotrophicum]|uniref:Heme exporter protein D n=1 Tax=Methylobacterium nonmethylotrophicum TaxID=1141884 RepID=A0A4Z0NJC1_9HYPH|nr:heme exporter protein CcmD [Methylobacterium nonmethylotrophicum]TGD96418.1 heme exporter protein CcmD [Methylobacterium nonmethylotrophicum]